MCVTTSSVEHEVGKADNLPQWLMGAATATKDLGTQVGQTLTALLLGLPGWSVVCGLRRPTKLIHATPNRLFHESLNHSLSASL